MVVTFMLVVFAWIFFRAENIGHATSYISEIFSPSLFTKPKFPNLVKVLTTIILTVLFVLIEWQGRASQYAIAHLGISWKRKYRWGLYYIIIVTLFLFSGKEEQFIYFQF